MFALLITDSTGETHIHPISPEEGRSYTLGRSEDCDIALPDEMHLSRTHCILTIYGHQIYLQDNNSSNGIFVGSRRVTAEYMPTEREYLLGNCSMVLIRTQSSPSQSEAETEAPEEAELPTADSPSLPGPGIDEPVPPHPEALPATPLPLPVADFDEEKEEESEDAGIIENTASATQEEPDTPPIPAAPVYKEEKLPSLVPEQEIPAPTPAAPRRLRAYKAEPRKLKGVHQPQAKPTPPPTSRKTIRTAAKRPSGKGTATTPRKLHTTAPQDAPRVQHAPGIPGDTLGLPADFGIQLRLLNTTAALPEGTMLKFGITTEKDCYLHLLHYDCNCSPTMLVPGVAGDDNRIFRGTEMQFPRPVNNEYELIVEPPFGRDVVIALACTQNTAFEKAWQKQLRRCDSPIEAIKKAIAACSPDHTKWTSSVLYLNTGASETPS